MRQILLLAALGLVGVAHAEEKPGKEEPTAFKPIVYKDPATGIVLYVESDGRHMAGIDTQGKVLWHRDATVGVHTVFRPRGPVTVSFVGSPQDWALKVMRERDKPGDYVGIAFRNSKEGGVLDVRTGGYTCTGSD